MEIEERAFVDSFSKIREKLKEENFSKKSEISITDSYFCREDVGTVEEVQMDEPGSYGLRIRESDSSTELNCKVIKNRGDHNAFIEHETDIEEASEGRKILKCIGFKNFCTINKTREIYKSEENNITVNIEDFEDFPAVIEIEVIADNNIEEVKQKIRDLIKKLDVNDEDIIDKSITLLYFRENACF